MVTLFRCTKGNQTNSRWPVTLPRNVMLQSFAFKETQVYDTCLPSIKAAIMFGATSYLKYDLWKKQASLKTKRSGLLSMTKLLNAPFPDNSQTLTMLDPIFMSVWKYCGIVVMFFLAPMTSRSRKFSFLFTYTYSTNATKKTLLEAVILVSFYNFYGFLFTSLEVQKDKLFFIPLSISQSLCIIRLLVLENIMSENKLLQRKSPLKQIGFPLDPQARCVAL